MVASWLRGDVLGVYYPRPQQHFQHLPNGQNYGHPYPLPGIVKFKIKLKSLHMCIYIYTYTYNLFIAALKMESQMTSKDIVKFDPKSFVSLELKEVAAKLNNKKIGYKNQPYSETTKGSIDAAMLNIVLIIKDFWNKDEVFKMDISEIEDRYKFENKEWIPSAIFKLVKMEMIRLNKRKTSVRPWINWVECEFYPNPSWNEKLGKFVSSSDLCISESGEHPVFGNEYRDQDYL